MNNQQIENIMFSRSSTRNVFSKVLPLDMLPPKKPENVLRPYALIVNLSKSSEKGSHWVAVYFGRNPMYDEYFDSFARKPPRKIEKLLGNTYLYNNKQIQNYFSSTCGPFCIYYIYRKCLGESMKQILKRFSKNLKENDEMISAWTFKNFNYRGKIYEKGYLERQVKSLLTRKTLSKT